VKGTLRLSSTTADIGRASTSVLANAMAASFGKASPIENDSSPKDDRSERRLQATGVAGWRGRGESASLSVIF
jgi:hypothetical protein